MGSDTTNGDATRLASTGAAVARALVDGILRGGVERDDDELLPAFLVLEIDEDGDDDEAAVVAALGDSGIVDCDDSAKEGEFVTTPAALTAGEGTAFGVPAAGVTVVDVLHPSSLPTKLDEEAARGSGQFMGSQLAFTSSRSAISLRIARLGTK